MDFDFAKVEAEYLPDPLQDTDEMLAVKSRLFRLSEAERRIACVYMEEGSYAGVSRFFGVSVPTARKYCQRVMEKLRNGDTD